MPDDVLKKPKKIKIPKTEIRPVKRAETTKKLLKKSRPKGLTQDELNRIGVDDSGKSIHFKKKGAVKDGSAEGHKLTGINQ